MDQRPIRVLLVEDDLALARLLQLELQRSGSRFDIVHAALLADALRRLESDSFDVLLLDLSLPDSRGMETVRAARESSPSIPIVVLTAGNDEAMGMEALRLGVQDYLVKGETDRRLLTRAILYAMERKRLTDELRALNETLEQRVAARTAEAEWRAKQLQRLASELTRVEQTERRRLAGILHDHLQQLLVAARMQLDLLQRHPDEAPQEQAIRHIDDLLGQAIEVSRSLTMELCPPILYQDRLVAAIEWLGRWMNETHGLTVHLDLDSSVNPQSEEVRAFIFHAARELLFNCVKHSGVREATVRLAQAGPRTLCVVVSDDGAGFDMARLRAEKRTNGGFGLFSIRERAEYLGGSFEVDSTPGCGSRFCITLPVSDTLLAPVIGHT